MVVLGGNFAVGCGPETGLALNTYIAMYARTNRCYNEQGSRTNYIRSSIPHCILSCGSDITWNGRSKPMILGFGGLGLACWPLVPRFMGLQPAEAVAFLG
jgi:hypothetical protein